MQHVLTPYATAIEPFVWWDNGFSEQELNWLQEQARRADQRAQAGGVKTDEELKQVRRSQVSWLEKNQRPCWRKKIQRPVRITINKSWKTNRKEY